MIFICFNYIYPANYSKFIEFQKLENAFFRLYLFFSTAASISYKVLSSTKGKKKKDIQNENENEYAEKRKYR